MNYRIEKRALAVCYFLLATLAMLVAIGLGILGALPALKFDQFLVVIGPIHVNGAELTPLVVFGLAGVSLVAAVALWYLGWRSWNAEEPKESEHS